jgi:hypothetical protein
MWREKTGTTDYRFPGKNLQKELVFVRKFQMSKFKIKVKVEVKVKSIAF